MTVSMLQNTSIINKFNYKVEDNSFIINLKMAIGICAMGLWFFIDFIAQILWSSILSLPWAAEEVKAWALNTVSFEKLQNGWLQASFRQDTMASPPSSNLCKKQQQPVTCILEYNKWTQNIRSCIMNICCPTQWIPMKPILQYTDQALHYDHWQEKRISLIISSSQHLLLVGGIH